MAQKAPFPGSSSLRGTLRNALLSDKLCLMEFYLQSVKKMIRPPCFRLLSRSDLPANRSVSFGNKGSAW